MASGTLPRLWSILNAPQFSMEVIISNREERGKLQNSHYSQLQKLLITIITSVLWLSSQKLLKCLTNWYTEHIQGFFTYFWTGTISRVSSTQNHGTRGKKLVFSRLNKPSASASPCTLCGLATWPARWPSNWDYSPMPMPFSMGGAKNQTQRVVQMWSHKCWGKGNDPFPWPTGYTLDSAWSVFAWSLPQGPTLLKSTEQWHDVGQCRCIVWLHSTKMARRPTYVRRSTYGHTVHNFIYFVEDCVDLLVGPWSITRSLTSLSSWFIDKNESFQF